MIVQNVCLHLPGVICTENLSSDSEPCWCQGYVIDALRKRQRVGDWMIDGLKQQTVIYLQRPFWDIARATLGQHTHSESWCDTRVISSYSHSSSLHRLRHQGWSCHTLCGAPTIYVWRIIRQVMVQASGGSILVSRFLVDPFWCFCFVQRKRWTGLSELGLRDLLAFFYTVDV